MEKIKGYTINSHKIDSIGFTLLELLVVIAIIAVLSTILGIYTEKIRDEAKIKAGKYFSSQLIHTISDSLIGEWHFDEGGNATSASDSSGYECNGVLANGLLWEEKGISNKALNSAITFVLGIILVLALGMTYWIYLRS